MTPGRRERDGESGASDGTAPPEGGAVDDAAPPLARSTVDRAAHLRDDPDWLAAAWHRSWVLATDAHGRTWCTAAQPQLALYSPQLALYPPQAAPDGMRLFLGVAPDDTPCFAVVAESVPDTSPPPDHPDAQVVTLRDVGADLGDRDIGLFTTAAALIAWHATHGYSPATGAPTTVTSGGWVRVDPTGRHLFPRTDPAVIVLVHDGAAGPDGRCLLGRHTRWRRSETGARFFSLFAGFVEPGESVEVAVARELGEEVGLTPTRLRYEGSQAWPFPASLMLGYTAQVDPAQPLHPDEHEIAEARWFTRTEIAALLSTRPDPSGAPHGAPATAADVLLPGPASIAHYLLRRFLHNPA